MHDLTVTGVEGDTLLASDEHGSRYRIPIDSETMALLRRRAPINTGERKVAPREIQSHIRAGMSATEVSALTGAPLEYIERFEGPVLAERNFVVESARAVPVNTASDSDPLVGSTFGSVMEERLEEWTANDVEWSSWKDPESGWIVRLSFSADEVEHDARWQFDPKKATLAPVNRDATRISQQGEAASSLIPRLRAVPADKPRDTTRFDSGAFTDADLAPQDTAPYSDPIPFGRVGQTVSPAAINSDSAVEDAGNTADLLEALRRRRGEREAAPRDEEDSRSAHPATGSMQVIDIPLDGFSEEDGVAGPAGSVDASRPDADPSPAVDAPAPRQRRGRASMPSWDDIVFGAKADDD